MDIINTQVYHSPCGDLLLGSHTGRLCLCNWMANSRMTERITRLLQAKYSPIPSDTTLETARQLDEYFNGERKMFNIPILFAGTDFQKRVWAELLNIPYGTTITYAEQASRIGNHRAIRAVGTANGANAISIIVPCHRVIGSNGSLTGYAGGINAKSFLLKLECGHT